MSRIYEKREVTFTLDVPAVVCTRCGVKRDLKVFAIQHEYGSTGPRVTGNESFPAGWLRLTTQIDQSCTEYSFCSVCAPHAVEALLPVVVGSAK